MGQISERIEQSKSSRAQISVLPWEIESVVTIRGSFQSNPDLAAGQGIVQDLAIGLLDKGTQSKSKLQIASLLENAGASISFSSDGPRIRFSAKCLKKDLEMVTELLAEQLSEPLFDEGEFSLLKQRVQAGIERRKQSTSSVARAALSRQLYSTSHPGYHHQFDELLEAVSSTTLETVSTYFRGNTFFSNGHTVLVGDVNMSAAESHAQNWSDRLDLTPRTESADHHEFGLENPVAGREHVHIADRNNLDVLFGHSLDITSIDSDYLSLWIAVFVLGGNFSSRLMSTIRDRDGLTYGIRSSLSGMSSLHGGSWTTSVTLSQENLEKGIQATQAEILKFTEGGVSEAELEERKQTMIGSYQVQLATTSGLASRLLTNLERGYPKEMVDDHTRELRELKLTKVNQMIGAYLRPDSLMITSAGTKI